LCRNNEEGKEEKNNNNKYVSPFFILSFNKCLLYSHFLFLFFVRENNFTARGNAHYGGCRVGSLVSPEDIFWGFYFFGFQGGDLAGFYRHL
jgi:hypothetical protein